MGISAELVDFDKEYELLDVKSYLINDFNVADLEQKERLERLVYTHYKFTDTIESGASCSCGYESRVDSIGTICGKCHTPVESTTNQPIRSMLWITTPEGVDGLFHPEAYIILENYLKTKEFNFLEYFISTSRGPKLDPDTIGSDSVQTKAEKVLAFKPKRGLNAFIRNFDAYIDFFFKEGIFNCTSVAERNELRRFIDTYKHLFFPKFLPIPSRICFVIETTTSGVYVDKPLNAAKDAIESIASIRSSVIPLEQQRVENRTADAIRLLATFYSDYTAARIAGKPGHYRRHVFGSRLHFAARAVIDSINDPHDYEELHLPWGLSIQLFKYHLINKLQKRGYSANESIDLIYRHVLQSNELLYELLNELIEESPFTTKTSGKKGIPCVLQRNR